MGGDILSGKSTFLEPSMLPRGIVKCNVVTTCGRRGWLARRPRLGGPILQPGQTWPKIRLQPGPS